MKYMKVFWDLLIYWELLKRLFFCFICDAFYERALNVLIEYDIFFIILWQFVKIWLINQ